MDFPDKWAAIVWMCRNQLGRRNISDEVKTVLIGEAYNAQKMTQGKNNQYVQDKSESHQCGDFQRGVKTEQIIAKKFNVGRGTVARAKQYVDGLDAAEKVSPGIKETPLRSSLIRAGFVASYKQVVSKLQPGRGLLFLWDGFIPLHRFINRPFDKAIDAFASGLCVGLNFAICAQFDIQRNTFQILFSILNACPLARF